MAVVPTEGITIAIADTENGTYAVIGQLLGIAGTKPTHAKVRTTVLSDTVQKYRPGKIPDSGEVSIHVRYDPDLAGHQQLLTFLATGDPAGKWFKITYNTALTTDAFEKFNAIYLSWETDDFDEAEEENLAATLTVQIISTITRTAGS